MPAVVSPRSPAPLRRAAPWAALLLLAAACGPDAAPPDGPATAAPPAAAAAAPPFVDRAAEVGLDFVHFNGMSGHLYLAEITCAGGGLADLDGDGDLDALLLQGNMVGEHPVAEASVPPRYPAPLTPRLYRNELAPRHGEAALRFTDVTAGADLPAGDYGCGIAVGDVDNDGLPDVYLGNLGGNRLLHNLGDLRFADVTARAGADDRRSSVAVLFFDYDRDGWLDLFVGNNVEFDNTGRTVCYSLTGAPDYCGPGAYPAQPDRLLHNRGDGTFEDVTVRSGLAGAPSRPTLGAVAADFDGDGWLDLYVANDGQPNNLWMNRHDGTFEDRALLAGSAVNANGAAEASMGVDAGDFDDDGDEDLFLAHLIKETDTLYVNDGTGLFNDDTLGASLGPASMPFTSFGAGFLDYDNDGWLDLLVVSGAVTDLPERVEAGDPFPLEQRNQLFHNPGSTGSALRFVDVSADAGPAFAVEEVSRAAAFGDVDDDGDPDVLVVNNNGPARLLLDRVGQDRRWLGLRLVTGDPPRDALGARAALRWDGAPRLWRRVRADGSYNASNDPRLLFGLGDRPAPAAVRVRWPDGTVEDFPAPPIGRYTTLARGSGSPAPEAR